MLCRISGSNAWSEMSEWLRVGGVGDACEETSLSDIQTVEMIVGKVLKAQ